MDWVRRERRSGGFGVGSDGDDEVVGGGGAGVAEAVEFAGGGVGDSAGAEVFGLAFEDELEGAFADEHEFGMDVAVGGVGHLAGEEGGFVEFDDFAGGEAAAEDGAGGGAAGGVAEGEFVVFEDAGVEIEGWDGFAGLGLGGGGVEEAE